MLPYVMLNTVFRGCLDLIFPRNCVLCRSYHPSTAALAICPDCLKQIPFNSPPFCLRCSRHVTGPAGNDGLCPDCRRNLPAFDQAWTAARYEGILHKLVPLYKFQGKTALRRTFAHIILTFLERYQIPLRADAVIPVPLTGVRLRERGYNQALFLAQALAAHYHIPLWADALARPKPAPRQSGLGRKERFTNMTGAFRINPSVTVTNKTIILVDDLVTTGATASNAALTLKTGGAASVTLITLAAA